MAKKFRLYINEELFIEKQLSLSEEQTHYLKNVVKYSTDDSLICFDNKNGDFLCSILEITKKSTKIKVIEKIKDFQKCPDVWLLFAPLKKDNTDFVIEKATELGCSRIIPVQTQYTNTTNIKIERYVAQSIEAAEQCRRNDLPTISEQRTLKNIIETWDTSRTLYFMDETLQSQNFYTLLQNNKKTKSAILIGPEGGFSKEELDILRKLPFAVGATLGPRILRAETAALSALSCWQMILGDWSK